MWTGTGSGSGYALGPAYVATSFVADSASGSDLNAQDLRTAISDAANAIRASMSHADQLSADILEFQLEMLGDPSLAEPALRLIEGGAPVTAAWRTTMDDYITAVGHGDQSDLASRNMDLVDIRNRVLSLLCDVPRTDYPAGSIFVGDDIEPGVFLLHDWSRGGGLVLRRGSTSSHVAMLAKSRGVPFVVGIGDAEIEQGAPVLVNGAAGIVIVDPTSVDITRARDAVSAPSVERIDLPADVSFFANVNQMSDLDAIDQALCCGIGLVRTEFLLLQAGGFADEARQVEIYGELVRRSPGPVTIRLLDLGGDKPAPGVHKSPANPFLGSRGVRRLLADEALLRPQIRALLRVGASADIRVLVPMVTVPAEMAAIDRIFAEEAQELSTHGVPWLRPQLGMMVEVPAAALTLESFAMADFFSIGTNDLLQYLAAAARDDDTVSGLYAGAMDALQKVMKICAETAGVMGKPLSVCGDLAGEPQAAFALYRAGVRHFSMAPQRMGAMAAALGKVTGDE